MTVRAPLRITLGGGGTDLPSYYSSYGGFSITAAIDKFIYIVIHERFDPGLRISYSKTELVEKSEQVQHPVVREALQLVGSIDHIEIISIADLPARTGLGSSGTFAVALLNALHISKGEHVSPSVLAEEACNISIERLREPSGKQDEYTAAFGGINSYAIHTDGRVVVTPVRISRATLSQLENELLLFYSGITRESKMILESQRQAALKRDATVIENLHATKQIGIDSKSALETGDLREFARLLREHWKTKKLLAPNATTPEIDAIYELALKNGADGGKIMGAGGGGFFLFHCDGDRRKFTEVLEEHGLRRMDFRLEFEGSKTIFDI